MSLLPIALGVTRSLFSNSASPLFAQPVDETSARNSIFKRDENSCRFCGFTATKYQQIHFLNGDRRDWNHDNMVTACIFCEQCLTLEQVASMKSGVLIWLPELAQGVLNHICRAIYIARISPGAMADAARAALSALQTRQEEAKHRLGTDDPATLSAVFEDYLEDKDYNNRRKKLDGVRLLPLDRRIIQEADIEFNQFPQILAYWRSKEGPFAGALPNTWADSFQSIAALEE